MAITFPNSPSVGQVASANGRTYTWTGYVWELASNVTSHAASHAAAGGDPLTLSASQITGLPTAGTGSGDYCAGNDARLVSDGNKGDITVSSNNTAWTINANAVITADIADSAVTDAKIATVAATKLTGTIADARLSSNVILASTLVARQHQTTAVFDTVDRQNVGSSSNISSGVIYWSFFTPVVSATISQIAVASGTSASSGVTLARIGLYTADASGNCTLVARTASDTSLLGSTATSYTRSLDSASGWPSSYALSAGTRYAVAMIVVGANAGSLLSSACQAVVAALSPRVQGVRTGNSDLVTSQTSGQYNGSVSFVPWFRLS